MFRSTSDNSRKSEGLVMRIYCIYILQTRIFLMTYNTKISIFETAYSVQLLCVNRTAKQQKD